MARGISESDVHVAADELVAAGERPTVERIRAHLGTGSPNTVTRWLDTWWKGLGTRLEAQQRRVAVPEAPEAISALAGEWWRLALEYARTSTLEALNADRTVLQKEREVVEQERSRFAAEAVQLRGEVDAAAHAERLASTQAAELQRLTVQLEGQVEEMVRQRDAALNRVTEADAARQSADLRVQSIQDAASTEREQLTQHVRAVEERAHAEIDRARQEFKELKAQLAAITKQHATVEKSLRDAAHQATVAATEGNRIAGTERARADAIEAQLAKLQDLPAALEAAMRRGNATKQQGSASKRGTRVAKKRT